MKSSSLKAWLKLIVGYLAAGAEIAVAVVIGAAVIRGIADYFQQKRVILCCLAWR